MLGASVALSALLWLFGSWEKVLDLTGVCEKNGFLNSCAVRMVLHPAPNTSWLFLTQTDSSPSYSCILPAASGSSWLLPPPMRIEEVRVHWEGAGNTAWRPMGSQELSAS